MKDKIKTFGLKSWTALIAGVGLIGSLISIFSVDFYPDIPRTRVSALFLVDVDNLQPEEQRQFFDIALQQLSPSDLQTKDEEKRRELVSTLDVPFALVQSNLYVQNQGTSNAEEVDVSFAYYSDQQKIFEEEFAGVHTIEPSGERNISFRPRLPSPPNFIEFCVSHRGPRPFEKVTERFLVNVTPQILQEHSSLSDSWRKRWFLFAPNCHSAPSKETIESASKYK